MALGFVLASLLILVALFQDLLAAVVRFLWHRLPAIAGALMAASLTSMWRLTGATARATSGAASGLGAALRRASSWRPSARREPLADPVSDTGPEAPPESSFPEELVTWEPVAESPPERRRSQAQQIGRQRRYTPASSIHVQEAAREFLQGRGGSAQAEALVRHLDQEFGSGRGVLVLETLRRRGLVRLARNPRESTQIVVVLREAGLEPRTDHVGG